MTATSGTTPPASTAAPRPPTVDELNGVLVPDEVRLRLRGVLSLLRNQTSDSGLRQRLDLYVGKLNPVMASADRLPTSYRKVVVDNGTVPVRVALLENHVIGAVLAYGRIARGEEKLTHIPDLVVLEEVAKNGWSMYHAVPKDRNSAIHILRTAAEHQAEKRRWEERQERALEAKANRLEKTDEAAGASRQEAEAEDSSGAGGE